MHLHFMFVSRNKKNNVQPFETQFYHIKVWIKCSTLHRCVSMLQFKLMRNCTNDTLCGGNTLGTSC